ncbi:MAG: GNAT family N-acetyltransferase [Sporomusaceae bacterium]|nr:GNAT family N-acetyltransferase [Sporomusaceae bacterium]
MEEKQILVRPVLAEEILKVQSFLESQLVELFCHKGKRVNMTDVAALQRTYIQPEDCNLWGAFLSTGELIGTGAVCRYNDRIALLKNLYHLPTTAEFGRCYVSQNFRRQGIGAQLVQTMSSFASDQNYTKVYLHTHHFLPGGFNFWKKQGFKIILEEDGPEQIVHMEKGLA